MSGWCQTGYHGTSLDSGGNILAQKRFWESRDDEEWLGVGVYFFKYDGDATWWCRRESQYMIIAADIQADPARVIDLDSPEDAEAFAKCVKLIGNRFKKRDDYRPRTVYDSVVLNFLVDVRKEKGLPPPDVVAGSFPENRPMIVDARIRLRPGQVQYCVKNKACIISFEEFKKGVN